MNRLDRNLPPKILRDREARRRARSAPLEPKKSPLLAGAFSLLYTGAGHAYLGHFGRGATFLVASALIPASIHAFTYELGVGVGLLLWAAGAFDAYYLAENDLAPVAEA